MPVVNLLRHPVGVLGVFVFAFVVWLWQDAVYEPEPEPLGSELRVVSTRFQIAPVLIPADNRIKLTPREIAQVVPKLKTGMTRAEVEGLVGEPAPGAIQPQIIGGDHTSYAMSYEADLTPPDSPMANGEPQSKSRTLVTLVFDATKPGHPLLGISYQEPRF